MYIHIGMYNYDTCSIKVHTYNSIAKQRHLGVKKVQG